MVVSFDVGGDWEPWVVFGVEGAEVILRQIEGLEGRGGRVVDFWARDLFREEDLFRAFAERLRFPGYFGWNWDAMVDCLDDLCGEVTGGVGVVGVIHDADYLIEADHFKLFVSVLCQGAARANSDVDLDGEPLDRPAISQHFVFLVKDFDAEEIVGKVQHPDLVVARDGEFVTVTLDPDVWFS